MEINETGVYFFRKRKGDFVMHKFEMTEKVRNKVLFIIMAISLTICTVLSFWQFFRYGVYKPIDISEEAMVGTDGYSWSIDSMAEMNDIYQVEGWIVRKQEDIKTRDIQFIIVNEDGTAYAAPTLMVKRTDVTAELNGEEERYNYDYAGFTTALNKKFINSDKSKLYILYGNNGHYEIVDIVRTFETE